jgi:hypothetical protein
MKKIINENVCRDCLYALSINDYLSIKGEKIMGKCPFKKYLILLSQQACENFKRKK